jgi:hypothetical protein
MAAIRARGEFVVRNCRAGALLLLLAACSNPDATSSPGQARTARAQRSAADIPVANAGFEEPGTHDRIPGWTLSQHAGPQAYEMTQDATAPFAGRASFRMQRTRDQIYGLLHQEIAIDRLDGKTLELSAMARTSDVGTLGWVIYIDVPGGRETSDALAGTTDWRELHVRAKVPTGTRKISIGALLLDRGTGWLDEVQLRVVEPQP